MKRSLSKKKLEKNMNRRLVGEKASRGASNAFLSNRSRPLNTAKRAGPITNIKKIDMPSSDVNENSLQDDTVLKHVSLSDDNAITITCPNQNKRYEQFKELGEDEFIHGSEAESEHEYESTSSCQGRGNELKNTQGSTETTKEAMASTHIMEFVDWNSIEPDVGGIDDEHNKNDAREGSFPSPKRQSSISEDDFDPENLTIPAFDIQNLDAVQSQYFQKDAAA